MNSYSQDLRERAVKLYITGDYTKKSLSDLLSVGYKTLRLDVKDSMKIKMRYYLI